MRNINLLPQEFKPKGFVLKISQGLKKLVLGGLIICIVSALAVSLIFFKNYLQFNQLQKEEDELVKQIQAAEATEHKYVLLKDRLTKIESFRKSPSAVAGVSAFKEITANLPEGIVFKKMEVINNENNFDITTDSSAGIAHFFAYLIQQGCSPIVLNSVDYQQKQGLYSVSVKVGVRQS